MEKRIYPYIIKEQKINKYYEYLLNYKYNVRVFEKKKDEYIYNLFLPQMRDKLFWTFNLRGKKKSFNELSNKLKSSVCVNYECNIFEKEENTIVCFNDGICFMVSDDKDEVKKLNNIDLKTDLSEINLREELSYEIPDIAKNKDSEEYIYLYILEIYKMIFLNKIHKDIQNPAKINKERIRFTKFIEEIYNTKITDDENALKQCEQWEKLLDIDKTQIIVDNEFEFLYKNNKINKNTKMYRICIILFSIASIIGIINLWGLIK